MADSETDNFVVVTNATWIIPEDNKNSVFIVPISILFIVHCKQPHYDFPEQCYYIILILIY